MNWTGHNEKYMEEKRKQLRNHSTPAEIALWNLIKNRQLKGRKFRRQFSIDGYVLDFYCPEEKLAIELDGAGHFTLEGQRRDARRDAYMAEQRIRTIRIENEKVFKNTHQVLDDIESHFRIGVSHV
jgi:very-short-patch-repair endonuclease